MRRCHMYLSRMRQWALPSPLNPLATPALAHTRRAFTSEGASPPPASSQRPAHATSHRGRRSHREGGGGYGGGRGQRQSQSYRHRGGPVKDRYPPITMDTADPRRRLAVLVDGTNTNLLSRGATRQDVLSNSSLFTHVMTAVAKVGVPVLMRVFAHQLPPEWDVLLLPDAAAHPPSSTYSALRSGHSAVTAMNDAPGAGEGEAPVVVVPLPGETAATAASPPAGLLVEYFRVERFIPIPMQMEADAQHIFDFRAQNHVEGVCYVCHEVDRALYETLMAQQEGRRLADPPSAEVESALLPERGGTNARRGGAAPGFFNQYLLDELGMVKECNVDGRPGDGS